MSIHRDDPQDRPGDQFQDGAVASDDLHDAEIVALFQAEAHRLKGYLAGLGADWSIIDDIIQDSFLATRRRWPDVRGYKHPKAYLYKVATNRMRRLHRDRYLWTEPHADPGQAAGHSAPEDPGRPPSRPPSPSCPAASARPYCCTVSTGSASSKLRKYSRSVKAA